MYSMSVLRYIDSRDPARSLVEIAPVAPVRWIRPRESAAEWRSAHAAHAAPQRFAKELFERGSGTGMNSGLVNGAAGLVRFVPRRGQCEPDVSGDDVVVRGRHRASTSLTTGHVAVDGSRDRRLLHQHRSLVTAVS